MPSPFVAVLCRELRKERVADPRLSDNRYATERLGISAPYWSLVVSGQRPPGAKVVVGAFRAYGHNHAAGVLPPAPEPLPDEWLQDGLEPGCGCVACDLAEAVSYGFAPVLRAPNGILGRRQLQQLQRAMAGTDVEPEAAAAN